MKYLIAIVYLIYVAILVQGNTIPEPTTPSTAVPESTKTSSCADDVAFQESMIYIGQQLVDITEQFQKREQNLTGEVKYSFENERQKMKEMIVKLESEKIVCNATVATNSTNQN